MNKYEIIKKIEKFAPPETAELWDCVGFMVETCKVEVSKIMLCLTVTENVVTQARNNGCDIIISHHPLFFVPLNWHDIDIYSAHTNLDKVNGGTTDTLIKSMDLNPVNYGHEFLRIVEFDNQISIEDFSKKILKISPNARLVNNKNIQYIKRAAFCAGSGSEFISDAKNIGADVLITGDLKFHTALDSDIAVYDIGHFESEILILPVLKEIIGENIDIVFADEKTPFSPVK